VSQPTVLGPWYIVQRLMSEREAAEETNDNYPRVLYYTAMEDGPAMFQTNKKRAMLFMSLGSASRVAAAEVAEVRVLTTKEEGEEFGR